MKWFKVFQFLVGSTLGITILVGGAVGAGFLLVRQLSTPPPRPVFENDKPVASSSPVASASPTPKATATPSPSPTASPLEPNAYRAIVAFPGGLAVRQSPSMEAERIGGIDYQQKIVVLETSSDQEWQRIRSESGELEGWVKAGNTEKVE